MSSVFGGVEGESIDLFSLFGSPPLYCAVHRRVRGAKHEAAITDLRDFSSADGNRRWYHRPINWLQANEEERAN
jgi:hypothetical protein